MSFLLDTNICSAHMRRPSGLSHRFTQHSGRLSISSIILAELYAWAYLRDDPQPILDAINDFIQDVDVVSFDSGCAKEFGILRGTMRSKGITVSPIDLMIASVALVHDLTLVTHNTADFCHIPNLRLDDWLAS